MLLSNLNLHTAYPLTAAMIGFFKSAGTDNAVGKSVTTTSLNDLCLISSTSAPTEMTNSGYLSVLCITYVS